MNQRLTVRELEGLLGTGGCEVVDVREGWERARCRIGESRHVPLRSLERESEGWAVGDPLVLVCKSGARSRRAAAILREKGFSQVSDLAGGLDAWKAEGLELEKDPGAPGAMTGQLRLVAGLLVVVGMLASQWWPPAIYLSGIAGAGLLFALMVDGGGRGRTDKGESSDSSRAGCQGGGGG